MNRDDLLRRFDAQVRRDIAAEPGFRIERTSRSVRVIGVWNCVLYTELDARSASAEIDAQITHFRALAEPLQWKVYAHDRPRALPGRLASAGFVPEECETLMILDLEHASLADAVPHGIALRRLSLPDELDDLAVVGRAAFGIDVTPLKAEFAARLPLETVAFYVAYAGREPVAAGRLELPPFAEFAGLYGGGTVPAFRHRGIYRSLVAARTREARARGYRYLSVEAAESSRSILQKLGFEPVSEVTTWRWEPD